MVMRRMKMTEALSEAQTELVVDSIKELLTDTDDYKSLRNALRDWITDFIELHSSRYPWGDYAT